MPLSNLDDLEAAFAEWLVDRVGNKVTQGGAWRRDNSGEWSKLRAYYHGTGSRPTLVSQTGKTWVEIVDALVEARGATQPPPPPPPPATGGEKLPPAPLVYAAPPSRVLAASDFPIVSAGAAGTYRAITGLEDAIVRWPVGSQQTAWPNVDNCGRVVLDGQGSKLANLHFGIKASNVEDLIVTGFDISGARVQAFMGTNSAKRVWILVTLRDNNPDPAHVGPQNAHALYLGSGGRWEHITVLAKILRHRGGYGLQAYDGYGVSGAGLFDAALMFTLEDLEGDPTWSGNGVGVLIAHGGNVRVANTLARRNARQIAGKWSDAGALSLVSSVDIERTGSDTDWFAPASGTPGTNPLIAGDPGYRHPLDPRTSGIGAP